MRTPDKMETESVRVIGEVMLFCSGGLWLLYLANVRSRVHFNAPNMGFLVWPALYTAVVGLGLVLLKKWAAVLSFAGCALVGTGFLLVIASRKFHLIWLLSTAVYTGFFYLVGIVPLRHWRELK